jgi:hypothetical protein
VLRWVAPQVESAELEACELRLDAEHRLTAIVSEQGWSVRDIRYGSRDLVRLKPPAWPTIPVVEVAEFGAGDVMRIFGFAMSLLDTKPKGSTNIAVEKTPVKR